MGSGPTFWGAIRGWSRVLSLAAVFCLFASVGLMSQLMHVQQVSPGRVVLRVLLSGGFAIAYALLAMVRRFKLLPLLAAVQFLVEGLVVKTTPRTASLIGQPDALQRQLMILAFCAMAGIIAAYSLLVHFVKVEGQHYFQVQTEMALAAEIHTSLVPICSKTLGAFEIYGASVPSGEVGGDLVDVVEQAGGWTAYVADVSGHGVQSGVLMAMFKTALRGQLLRGGCPAQLFEEVHRTLFPLKLSNMFVTAGILQSKSMKDGEVAFALAGHPSILHYHENSGEVREYAAMDPPLGIMEKQEFSESSIQCGTGDVLVILTDGLTEVFDARGNEMSVEPLKENLRRNAGLPLAELFEMLRAVSTQFGRQIDDQTLLLARYRS